MRFESYAVLEMLQDNFIELVKTEFLTETYNKIYVQLDASEKVVFDNNYTLTGDFYILSESVTDTDKEIIKNACIKYRYGAWSNGLPTDVSNDILFAVYNKNWEDNLENEYIKVTKAVHIFADVESYSELEIITRKLKSVELYVNIDEQERTYSDIVFREVESSGVATKTENTYIVNIRDKEYYPVELIFNMEYYRKY